MTIPETAALQLRQASGLGRAGRLDEAIEIYRRVLEQHPRLADTWYNLAHLQERAGWSAEALASYQRALDCNIARPEEVHLNRAVILAARLARPEAAEEELQRAVQKNPNYWPAWLNLGNLHEQRGDRPAALEAYGRVLQLHPGQALALARVLTLTPADTTHQALLERARQVIRHPQTRDDERADLGFGLGKMLDELGEYDEAFNVYSEANHASRRSAGPGAAAYDRSAHERQVDAKIRTFNGAPALSDEAGEDARSPIFICGMFRSGSTLVEQILAGHPRVTPGGELELLPRLVQEHLGLLGRPALAAGPASVDGLRKAYLDGIAARYPAAGLLTDKRPDNFLYIGWIKSMFPRAKIIHTRRNPLDNCLSVFFLHLTRSMPYALDLLDIGHWYRQYRRLMQHWQSVYPGEIFEVDYDELVRSPRPVVEGLLQYCDLPWDDACLHFHRSGALVSTASLWQVRQPLYTRSSGRWKHYERHLRALKDSLAGMAD